MLCPWCHGKGVVEAAACGMAKQTCPECGGCGILHCCEGLVEQPVLNEDQTMARDRQDIGQCGQCKGGTVTCTHNAFVDATQTIHSWEHRCSGCGHRETQAFRSGESPTSSAADPTVCPYCSRQAAG